MEKEKCAGCGKMFEFDDMFEWEEDNYCEDCFEQMENADEEDEEEEDE